MGWSLCYCRLYASLQIAVHRNIDQITSLYTLLYRYSIETLTAAFQISVAFPTSRVYAAATFSIGSLTSPQASVDSLSTEAAKEIRTALRIGSSVNSDVRSLQPQVRKAICCYDKKHSTAICNMKVIFKGPHWLLYDL